MGEVQAHAVGQVIGGRYVLERVIGRGGMGVVWQARHNALGTAAAVKFLYGASASNEQTKKRFVTEARVSAQLKTRHAVQVFDFGVTDDGQPYLVMELLDGESVAQRLAREKQLSLATTDSILGQAARALERAHAMGIVHRDFKPENIFITSDEEGREQVKVMDFGVAKLVGQLDGEIEAPATALPRRPLSRFTKTGSMLGTPYYMAPEQIVNSANLGPTADVWALGVVAYECLTGCVPFDANDLADLFANIHARKYAPARSLNPDVPATFEEWFNVACAAEAASRFSSASGAADALSEALGRPNDAPRSGSNPSLPSSGEARRDFRSTPGRTTPAAAATPPSSGRRMTPLDSIDARAETLPTDTPSVRDDASSRLPEKPWTSSVARTPAPRARGKSLAVGVAATAVLSVVGIGVWRSRAHVDPPAPSQSPPESVSALNLSPSSEIASAATTNTPNAAIASASHAPSVPAAPVVESPGVKPSRARRPAPTAKAEPAAANEAPSAPPPPSAPPATAKPSGAPAFTLPPVGF